MNTTPRSRRFGVLSVLASLLGLGTKLKSTGDHDAVRRLTSLPDPVIFLPQVRLSGTEIASVRINASRSQLPTRRRLRATYRQCIPHVGKKQLAKIAARAPFDAAAVG